MLNSKKVLVALYLYCNGDQDKIMEMLIKKIHLEKEEIERLIKDVNLDDYKTLIEMGQENYYLYGYIVEKNQAWGLN